MSVYLILGRVADASLPARRSREVVAVAVGGWERQRVGGCDVIASLPTERARP